MTDNPEISETVKAANMYLAHLKNLNTMIQNAEQQICDSSKETETIIQNTFSNLLRNLTELLLTRKETLLKRVHDIKCQSLVPLEECKADVSKRMEKTHKLISEGQYLLNNSNQDLNEFNQKSSQLGSLPEIPELKDVPYISFQFEPNLTSELLDMCSQFGEVFKIAPIQITQSFGRPGAILIEWHSVDNDERYVDIQEFRLQKAFGDVITQEHLKANFSDCYIGVETQFLVKDLQANQPYSFRVCCKFEGSSEWSPWSLSHVTSTSIKPFSWAENKDYILTNDNKIATPIKESPSLLISDGPQLAVSYSVEFTYLELDNECCTVGLIVCDKTQDVKNLKSENHNYFALASNGEIYVDGTKKSTKLPEATKGIKICFMCELIQEDKIRVNVDICEKRVTYDWHICKTDQLYFAAQLKSPKNKIMVE